MVFFTLASLLDNWYKSWNKYAYNILLTTSLYSLLCWGQRTTPQKHNLYYGVHDGTLVPPDIIYRCKDSTLSHFLKLKFNPVKVQLYYFIDFLIFLNMLVGTTEKIIKLTLLLFINYISAIIVDYRLNFNK